MMIPKKASNKALGTVDWRLGFHRQTEERCIAHARWIPDSGLKSRSCSHGSCLRQHQLAAAAAAASASSLGAAAPAQYCIVTPDTQIFCDDEAEVLQAALETK